jgi:DNA-binding transcriptional ArsR family regulator
MQTKKSENQRVIKNAMRANARKIARLLKVLANENRLLIFCALMDDPLSVGQIAEKIQAITQPALSQHLAILKAHGILDSVKSGQSITYSIADHRVEQIIRALKKYYCD